MNIGDRVRVREKADRARPRGAAPTGIVCELGEWPPLVRVDFSTKFGPELKGWFREDELELISEGKGNNDGCECDTDEKKTGAGTR